MEIAARTPAIYKQALAMRSHYRKRGAEPPEFEQVRL